MTVLLQGQGLTLALGGRTVLHQVSLDLHAGQWLAIVGPNGAGKSSLLSALAGLRAPQEGEVRLAGRVLASWPMRERARRLAWLGQGGASGFAESELAVQDVVQLGRLPHLGLLGRPGPADVAAVAQAMAECEIEPLATRRLAELSGGERQRVWLARALATQAPVLLLDEPTTHLDAPHQRALARSLRSQARAGAAVASVLHDLTLALAADRVAVLAGGRLLACAAPGDATLQATLAEVFDHAIEVQALAGMGGVGGPRWVALPRLD